MLGRPSTLPWVILVASATLGTGCFLDRGGIDPGQLRDAGPRPDGQTGEDDAGTDVDSGEPCMPSGPELCDGADNDCDPATADGADEDTLGDACDAPEDVDLCADGALVCSGGALACAGDDGDQPDEVEVCDTADNDCNGDTADGAGDPGLAAPCDDELDADLCAGGMQVCMNGSLVCMGDDGDRPDEVELCDGADNDCNEATPDGSAEGWIEGACDDGDLDLCSGGSFACSGGGMVCAGDDGDLASEVELCDGMDNDCNAATLDGASDPGVGMPCDDGDADRCPEGTSSCVGGAIACTGDDGDQPGEIERCDGVDNDCNPLTLDGAADVGARCDGPDMDSCNEGMITGCAGGVPTCSDATGDSVETCNGDDDDCDATIDEGAGCPCTHVTRAGRSYLFCGSETVNWWDARDYCTDRGYALVTINDAGEQAFVTMQTTAISTNPWWIGLNDRDTEGTYTWIGGGTASYRAWRTGQPNDFGGGQDCVVAEPTAPIGTTAALGGWNDAECWFDFRLVCEAGP